MSNMIRIQDVRDSIVDKIDDMDPVILAKLHRVLTGEILEVLKANEFVTEDVFMIKPAVTTAAAAPSSGRGGQYPTVEYNGTQMAMTTCIRHWLHDNRGIYKRADDALADFKNKYAELVGDESARDFVKKYTFKQNWDSVDAGYVKYFKNGERVQSDTPLAAS